MFFNLNLFDQRKTTDAGKSGTSNSSNHNNNKKRNFAALSIGMRETV